MISFVWESLKQALKALGQNKVRTFMTMLGVIIGIFSVITLVTIGEGAKGFVTDQIKNLGAGYDSFVVASGKDATSVPVPQFTYADINFIKSKVLEVKDVMALSPGSGDIYYEKKKVKAPVVMGVSANMLELMGGNLSAGRFFTEAEVESRKKVAVVGPSIIKAIFGQANPLGEKIKLQGKSYIIIGVSAPVGSVGPFDMDKRTLVPITTLKNIMGNNKVFRLNVFPHDVAQMEITQEKVRQVLIRRLGKEDFRFMTQKGMLNIVNNILTALTGFVSGIAAISLLVGGIGIMNIMLVAVNERIREIGIRKALGAKKRDIVLQFLVEAMLISLIGGGLGIVAGLSGAFLIMWIIKGKMLIVWWAVGLATIVSAVVGIFFGVYPAMRAAALDPVEALRYE